MKTFIFLFILCFLGSVSFSTALEVKKAKNKYGGITTITIFSKKDNKTYEFKILKKKELYQDKNKKTIKLVYYFFDDYVSRIELSKTKNNKTLELTYYNKAGIEKFKVDKKVILKNKGKVERQEYFKDGKKVDGDC